MVEVTPGLLEYGLRSLVMQPPRCWVPSAADPQKMYHQACLQLQGRCLALAAQPGALSPGGVGRAGVALGLSCWGCPPGVGRTLQPAFCFLLQMADCGGLPQVVQVRKAPRLSRRGWLCGAPCSARTKAALSVPTAWQAD